MQQCQLSTQSNRAFVGFQEQLGDVDVLRREIVETFDEQVTLVIPVGDCEKSDGVDHETSCEMNVVHVLKAPVELKVESEQEEEQMVVIGQRGIQSEHRIRSSSVHRCDWLTSPLGSIPTRE